MPVAGTSYALGTRRPGLIIVDEIVGFAEIGAGPLAPMAPCEQVARMLAETDRLARAFVAAGRPILALLDSHEPGKPEPPYPPHCELGSGEEELVEELAWLADEPLATLLQKDCINGFVGAIDAATGANSLTAWATAHRLDTLIVVGICTDICVMDLVLTLLSARNHGLAPTLDDVVVYEPGCATYDLPLAAAIDLGLDPTAVHPRDLYHHIGLKMMAMRGAIIADRLDDRDLETGTR